MDTYNDRMKVRFFDPFPGLSDAREGSAMPRRKDNCLEQFNTKPLSITVKKQSYGRNSTQRRSSLRA